jgi:hypothetical protein
MEECEKKLNIFFTFFFGKILYYNYYNLNLLFKKNVEKNNGKAFSKYYFIK